MKLTETCSCGASFSINAWLVRDFDTAGFEQWRQNHRHEPANIAAESPQAERECAQPVTENEGGGRP